MILSLGETDRVAPEKLIHHQPSAVALSVMTSLDGGVMRICSIDGCDKKLYAAGYCHTHHRRIIGIKYQCSVPGCNGRFDAHGLCTKHYQRFRLYGTLDLPYRPVVPLIDRLRALLEVTASGCWEFQGNRNKGGYGRIGEGRENVFLAHRVAYHYLVTPIDESVDVLHRCDNPPCCNPDHLFLGSQSDNAKDMWAKGRGVNPPIKKTKVHHGDA
jgi:hypothetical protein